ncbi:hypothetical protein Q8791_23680 [Nocardiopsis sp. CT-R113]|uniref:DNA-binding protein n=1 Tax=Nocardiopsis codii TaxID=3065942 RepID=A0ABU7KDB5_9ACTN|nr:hypothetical protein [Nocardiopsis sp. CT-R113]MEE2040221.1 hypothetical protein [Nocardiopsis sp. CT-R113]
MIQPLTLIDYARTLQLDPANLLAEFADNPDALPEPAGTKAGQPTYDPDELDHARGITTIAGFAKLRHLDETQVRRWINRHPALWPEPVGQAASRTTGPGAMLYPLDALDLVHAEDKARVETPETPAENVTMDEYAKHIGVSPATVKNRWRVKFKEIWPDPAVGEDGKPLKRGRAALFPFEGLERVRRAAKGLPEPVGSPHDRLTREQVKAYLGLTEEQQWWREYRGHWPAGEVVSGPGGEVEVWERRRVEELHAGLVERKGSRGE